MSPRITPFCFSAGVSSRVLFAVSLLALCAAQARAATTTVSGSSTTSVTLNSGDALVVNANGTCAGITKVDGGVAQAAKAGRSGLVWRRLFQARKSRRLPGGF